MSEPIERDAANNAANGSTPPSEDRLTVAVPNTPPTLSPAAAAILLRLLWEAAGQHPHDHHLGSDATSDAD